MGKRRRGHIEQYRGKFRAVVSAGSDPLTGKRRQPKSPLFDTEKEAEVELTKMLNQVDEQRHPKNKILVSQLIEKWFEVAELEDTTRERSEGLNRKYIEPVFGSTEFAKLDPELLEKFSARLRKCKHLCDGRRSRTTSAHRSAPARYGRSTSS
jgi:integrase